MVCSLRLAVSRAMAASSFAWAALSAASRVIEVISDNVLEADSTEAACSFAPLESDWAPAETCPEASFTCVAPSERPCTMRVMGPAMLRVMRIDTSTAITKVARLMPPPHTATDACICWRSCWISATTASDSALISLTAPYNSSTYDPTPMTQSHGS
jgi:hypothetical protein